MVKHKLSSAKLDTLFFLYSEQYFDKTKFNEFNTLLSWNPNRFTELLRDGWIFNYTRLYRGRGQMYALSPKSKNLVESFYRKLEGEEIPTEAKFNPLFMKKVSYTDKIYQKMIKKMTEATRAARRKEAVDTMGMYD